MLSRLKSFFQQAPLHENPLDSMPDFSSFQYQIAVEPPISSVEAWAKLRECERRLALYAWAEARNDPAKAQHRILLDDCLSALLLSYEATLQYVKDQFSRSASQVQFSSWLSQQPDYDVVVKGLRTLRHIEAHVEDVSIQSLIKAILGGSLPDGTSATQVSRTWKLPKLDQDDLNKLRTPPIRPSELPDWNSLVDQRPAEQMLSDGLARLRGILAAAELVI